MKKDLYTGITNGSLTVIDLLYRTKNSAMAVVMCSCGAIDIIDARQVKAGNSTSCKRFINYKVDCGNYYEVYTHDGRFTLVDKDDYYKYFSNRSMNIDSLGYAFISINNRTRVHRIVMGNPKGFDIDHINGNRLDNRKSNLRKVSKSENLRNSKKRISCSSKYKGVCWIKESKQWLSYCNVNGKRVYRELFDSEIEAARSYDKYALKLHGEFARTNKMLGLLV